MNFRLLFSASLLILISGCGKSTQESAAESLIGQWSVNQIFEIHTTVEDGVNTDQSQFTFDSTNGNFTFTKDELDYQYTTTTQWVGSQNYTLVTTKENAGFTRVDVFTIKGDVEEFRVRYGDQTNDAHEDANRISLEQTIETDSLVIERFIELTKE